MTEPLTLPSRRHLNLLFDYNPRTGVLRYKTKRSRRLFASAALWIRYHKLYAGRPVAKTKSKRHLQVRIGYTRYSVHRIIYRMMTGKEPPNQIDHKNHDGKDNRWRNLRAATQSQNNGNRLAKKNRPGTLKGTIFFHGKWRASIARQHLGTYNTEQEAHAAYMRAAKAYYGEFAYDGH